MAKVAAAPGSISTNAFQFGGGGGAKMKRKTPSELRGEQLKRKNVVEIIDESPAPSLDPLENSSKVCLGIKKPESFKSPKYIDTRLDEVYPVRKSRLRMPSGKENAKDHALAEQSCGLSNFSVPSMFEANSEPEASCSKASMASSAIAKDVPAQVCQMTDKCTESSFRSVAELSLGNESLSGLTALDMGKALKGFKAHEPPTISSFHGESSERLDNTGNFCSEFHVCGQNTPLDLTLKTNMRVVSSSSVTWFHRFIMGSGYNSIAQFSSLSDCSDGQDLSHLSGSAFCGPTVNSRALHSWIYPQSSLPASVISVLTLSTAEGVEMDFLRQRHQAWEDSFRSLYYMLRKNACNIFYVCTPQFVVMFTGYDGVGKCKSSCNAYISQSTRGLRSQLKEHDVCFSMPLCHSKVEDVSTEDLVELSEIEKHNIGQTRRLRPMLHVDGTAQSLLAFNGNENVHGLYDFLLNYRSFLTSLTGVDVPVLYSPIAFQNASLSSPEIICKELKRADHIALPPKGSIVKDGKSNQGSSSGVSHIIEIKDKYIPPWIICTLCSIIGSEGRSFEASFMTEPTSIGLNVALETVSQKSNPQSTMEGLKEVSKTFGFPDAVVTPHLCHALLKGLKYSNSLYTASLSAI